MIQETQTMVQWEWKSNSNPFSQSEEDQWTPYDSFQNNLLEEAYTNQQKEVDIGDYIIYIKDMLQRKKDNVFQQRPIRRKIYQEEEEANVRIKRFFGAETPKTYNNAFGNLSDYLKFFENRGPEIQAFTTLFNEIEAKNNLDLLHKVVQSSLIRCIEEESQKDPVPSKFLPKIVNKLRLLFKDPVTSMKQFYAQALKAYTIESFLYQNLNRYLRNEDWSQLDTLLPFAYCLCKAFLHSDFASDQSNQLDSMIVYRGAQFDEVTLSFYDPNTVKNFCWNAVTSTSRKREIGVKFMEMGDDPKRPIKVLFLIEVPPNFEIATKWIDVKPYSAVPSEDEIVLSPGSVFELKGISGDKNSSIEIHLRLIIDVEKLAHQGQIMHGAMYSEMINKASLKLVDLEGKELSDALAHLKGNELIEELEFCRCKLDDRVQAAPLEEIKNLKRLIFISPFTGGSETFKSTIFQHLAKAPIERLEVSDVAIDDHRLNLLSKEMSLLPKLQSLSLDFRGCEQITDEGLKYLTSQALQHLTSLRFLTLNFMNCDKITNEGLSHLASQGLQKLSLLSSLNLNFKSCFKITDDGLRNLSSQALKNLIELTSLTLDFTFCQEITDAGLDHLIPRRLESIDSLTSLALSPFPAGLLKKIRGGKHRGKKNVAFDWRCFLRLN